MPYLVKFERVGRNHDVAPLNVVGDDPNEIAEQIFRYAAPKLLSRDVDVHVDLSDRTGCITAGFHNAGNFTLEPVQP